jgi:hypothetical protein
MFGRKNSKNDVVRIDVDWLLGQSAEPARADLVPSRPRNRKSEALATSASKPRVAKQIANSAVGQSKSKNFVNVVLFLGGIVVCVWSWPYLSKQWLRFEWSQQLAHSDRKSSDEVLPILLALNELNPANSDNTIEQLGNENSEKRLVAYHLLLKRIEGWEKNGRPNSIQLDTLTKSLHDMKTGVPESILLRAQLAARMVRFVDKNESTGPETRSHLDDMIAMARNVDETASASASMAAALNPNKSTPVRSTTVRLSDSPAILSDVPSTAQLPPPTVARLSDSETPSSLTPSTSAPSTSAPSTSPSSSDIPPTPKIASSIANDMTLAQNAPEVFTPNASWREASIPPPVNQSPTVVTKPMMDSSQSSLSGPSTRQPMEEPQLTRGIEKLQLEQLLPLLASTQPKLAQQATSELVRRGMSRAQLEIAVAIAQGDIDARIAAMDQLVRDPSLDAIPWLAWMAEQSDPRVRRKAISVLGSMSNPEANRKLRILKNREPDGAIADQISQVLLATGTVSNSRR